MESKRFYFHLLKIPVHLLYGCTFFCLITIMILWRYGWYAPLVGRNSATESAIATVYKEAHAQRHVALMARQLTQRATDLKADFSAPQNKKDAPLCALVTLAQKNGLHVSSAKLCKQKNKSWCTVQEVYTECKGNLDQIISFFEQSASIKPLLRCKSCEIARADKEMLSVRTFFHAYIL